MYKYEEVLKEKAKENAPEIGTIDRESIKSRTQNMSEKELMLTIHVISSDDLWNELKRRYENAISMIEGVRSSLKIDGSNVHPEINFDEIIGQFTETVEMVNDIKKAMGMGA